ncbi:nucleotidyltransferase family protein [Streptomyces capparidis]
MEHPDNGAGPGGLRLAVGDRAAEPASLPERDPRQDDPAPPLPPDLTQAVLEATKQVGGLLKGADHPFALAGSVAAYAHGAEARLQHDTDFCILREDADAVTATLRGAGIDVRVPPEDWLIKAWYGGVQIDLIFELARRPVDRELLGRAETLPVNSVRMPVLAPTDLVGSLLGAFSEHYCDFGAVLPIARALREKVDWALLRAEYRGEPMPESFLYLLERLNVIEPREAGR